MGHFSATCSPPKARIRRQKLSAFDRGIEMDQIDFQSGFGVLVQYVARILCHWAQCPKKSSYRLSLDHARAHSLRIGLDFDLVGTVDDEDPVFYQALGFITSDKRSNIVARTLGLAEMTFGEKSRKTNIKTETLCQIIQTIVGADLGTLYGDKSDEALAPVPVHHICAL